MRFRTGFFALLLVALAVARWSHANILWAEEGLPLAAARQMLAGKTLFREIWFDKPPLLAAVYLLWDAQAGWILRLAGALICWLSCILAYLLGRELWHEGEGLWAGGLLGFFLLFDYPAGVIPLAADLLMLPAHLAAMLFIVKHRPFAAGLAAAAAFWINPKGLFVAASCFLWTPVSVVPLALGFAAASAAAAGILYRQEALSAYVDQVWRWGRVYAGGTFLENPLAEGVKKVAGFSGFHAALGAGILRGFPQAPYFVQTWLWLLLSFVPVVLGFRFFPRYFLQVLPPLVLMASRSFAQPGRWRAAMVLLLLIPAARFGPRYGQLAAEAIAGTPHSWADVAMDQDAQAAGALLRKAARPGETLFVWGFRPDLYVYSGLLAAAPFLDSQPLTGVPADRHLRLSEPVAPELAARNRQLLVETAPDWIADGLGPLNGRLAISRYPDLARWLERYEVTAQTGMTVVYRRKR